MVKERDPERSKQAILNAAEHEFSDKGYYGARVDRIADLAGINKRMIYAYFYDKESLYQQVLTNVYQRMAVVEKRLSDQKLEGKELIIQIISSYFDFLQSNQTFVNILMWENLNKGKYLKQITRSYIERDTIGYFIHALEKGKQSGVFRTEIDPWQSVVSLITTCYANFSNRYTLSVLFSSNLGDSQLIKERKEHTIQIMLSYLCGNEGD